MTVLLVAGHDGRNLNPAVCHAVSAAAKLGEVHLLLESAVYWQPNLHSIAKIWPKMWRHWRYRWQTDTDISYRLPILSAKM